MIGYRPSQSVWTMTTSAMAAIACAPSRVACVVVACVVVACVVSVPDRPGVLVVMLSRLCWAEGVQRPSVGCDEHRESAVQIIRKSGPRMDKRVVRDEESRSAGDDAVEPRHRLLLDADVETFAVEPVEHIRLVVGHVRGHCGVARAARRDDKRAGRNPWREQLGRYVIA